MPRVYAVQCQSYEKNQVLSAMRELFRMSGLLGVLSKRGQRVLLKPNLLSSQPPEKAVTTHPAVLEGLITVLREAGLVLEVGDSPAVEDMMVVMQRTGVADVLKRHGVKPANFKSTVHVENHQGMLVKRFEVVRAFEENDMVISLPKLKTHTQMFYTGAIKNLFGLVQGLQKSRFHFQFPQRERFAQMIVDLYKMVNPVMSMMDAVVAMEGEGPQGGHPKQVGLLLASEDTLALDIVAARLIGYKVEMVPILERALSMLPAGYVDSIEVVGVDLEAVKPRDFVLVKEVSDMGFINERLPWLFALLRHFSVPKPVFLHKKCIRCGRCLQICSAQALSWKEAGAQKQVAIDYKKCIQCFCCHEICPVDAIDLRRKLW